MDTNRTDYFKLKFLPQFLSGTTSPPTAQLAQRRYIQVGIGFGFYVPEDAFQCVQALANETGKTHFLASTKDGRALYSGQREDLLDNPEVTGGIVWITPRREAQ